MDERKQTPIESKYKDAFGNNIFEGMIVYCVNTHYDDRFAGYIKGVVVGFTEEFIKIQIMNYDKTIKYHIYDENPPIYFLGQFLVNYFSLTDDENK